MSSFLVNRINHEGIPQYDIPWITWYENRGVYDLFKQWYVNVADPCCCPEMDCCQPTVITVQLNGFPNGTRIRPDVGPVKSLQTVYDTCAETIWSYTRQNLLGGAEDLCEGVLEYRVRLPDILQSSAYEWSNVGGVLFTPGVAHCNLMYENNIPTGPAANPLFPPDPNNGLELCATETAWYNITHPDCNISQQYIVNLTEEIRDGAPLLAGLTNYNTMWPQSLFPPIYCDGATSQNVSSLGVVRLFSVENYENVEYSNITKIAPDDGYIHNQEFYKWSEICSDVGEGGVDFLCTPPPTSPYHVGPCADVCHYEKDLNDRAYVCRKIRSGNRPELLPIITRQIPLTEELKNDPSTEAVLLFEVAPRRKWQTSYLGSNCIGRFGIGADYPICGEESLGDSSTIQGFSIEPLPPVAIDENNNPTELTPLGNFFCVDYRCSKRWKNVPNESDGGFTDPFGKFAEQPLPDYGRWCYNMHCTAGIYTEEFGADLEQEPTLAGAAKPHLAAYEHVVESGSGAVLKVLYEPIYGPNYETDHGKFPYAWYATDIEIIDGGSKYNTNDIFLIDFDVNWLNLPYIHGQYIFQFPTQGYCGGIPYSIDWADKYGFSQEFNDVANGYPFQRFKVSSVGSSGNITDFERIPWYKDPEYPEDDILCENEITNIEEKTKYYPKYTRFLCHPNSVSIPGKGYTIGDTITWECYNSDLCKVWKDNKATAVVVDVDDDGGILDWYIRGSDAKYQWGFCPGGTCATCDINPYNSCYNPEEVGNLSLLPGTPYATKQEIADIDDRGCYYYYSENLCNLSWYGIGVPVRARNVGFPIIPGGATPTTISTEINSSNFTNVTITINRKNSQTSLEVLNRRYPFDHDWLSFQGGWDIENPDGYDTFHRYYKRYFPPYPECVGGGAIISPIFGPSGANGSLFGSSLTGAVVETSGAYYSFIDKIHVEPILPTGVPEIPGSNGKGAVLNYSFEKIDNFPHPEVLNNFEYNNGFTINDDRFAYFSINGITIVNAGSGYAIGETFEVYPEGGTAFSDPWTLDGGDNPDALPNGAWYEYKIDPDNGYMTYPGLVYDTQFTTINVPSKATLIITDVDPNGGIAEIEVAVGEIGDRTFNKGGLMYRPVWTSGAQHPDIYANIESTLGYGAAGVVTVETNKNSDTFGKVINYEIITDTNIIDPLHGYDEFGISIDPPVYVGPEPGQQKIGHGREYADPGYGYFWMLDDTYVGVPGSQASLLAYFNRGDRQTLVAEGNVSSSDRHAVVELNYLHPDQSTHRVYSGSAPPYVPISTVCAFSECYHSLLNKTYPLYRIYDSPFGPNIFDFARHNYNDRDFPPAGNRFPEYRANDINYCTIIEKNKSASIYRWMTQAEFDALIQNFMGGLNACGGDTSGCENYADGGLGPCGGLVLGELIDENFGGFDSEGPHIVNIFENPSWKIIEYGMSMQISHTLPENCPEHTTGKTETYFETQVINTSF